MTDASESELIIEENPEPGVLRTIRSATGRGPTLRVLTPEEWERVTGMGEHVSLSFGSAGHLRPTPGTPPAAAAVAGSVMVCPACRGRGYFDETPGGGATCVFCVGEGHVTAAEAHRYDPAEPLNGAQPTLRRLKILIDQLDPTGVRYRYQYRLDPARIKYPYRLTYPYLRARMWLEHYGFTLERLQADLIEDGLRDARELQDALDDLWGFDGRNYAREDFTADSPTGSGNDRWDECDFSGSTLTGANFHEVDLTDSVFNGADLTEANLTGANLTRASLRDATLARAMLDGAILVGADLTGANLSGASLRGAVLTGADLAGTILTGVDVTGAEFRGTTALDWDALADLRRRGAMVDDPEP